MKLIILTLAVILAFSFLATAQASAMYYHRPSYNYVPSYGQYRPYVYPSYNYGNYYHVGINSQNYYFSGSYYNYRPYAPYYPGSYCQCVYYVNGHRFCC